LGSVALAWLLAREGAADTTAPGVPRTEQGPWDARVPHFTPRARRVIQIFLTGGVSHVDTFDYKPDLHRFDGKPLTGKGTLDPFFAQPGNLARGPFSWAQHGHSGKWVSSLFPHLATCVDDLTFFHAMVARSSNHTPATFQMNSGFTMNGFPCVGSWVSYGLGTESRDLPAFVVLPDPRQLPAGGAINWTAGFLPASHQGVAFRTRGEPIPDLFPAEKQPDATEIASRALLRQMNEEFLQQTPGESSLDARIRSYELAARMQLSIPEAYKLDAETAGTRALYWLDDPVAGPFGRNCLLARRLLERGVRFVQLYHGGAFSAPRVNWDAHEDIKENHTTQSASMDRPVTGLLKDLKARGMLEDTLVIWCSEFGRTPFTQGLGAKGRDHHQLVFTCWMAGAGLKPGISYGESDEVGYAPGRDPTTIYDLHATILDLLGLDHKRLTYYHNGIRRRLTDVHGEVIQKVLA
jgi:hypothetical protein